MAEEVTGITQDERDKAHKRLLQYAQQGASPSAQQNNALAIRDRNYKDGMQLTPDVVAGLDARGQAPLVFNYVGQKINTLTGLERQQRRDVVAKPRRKMYDNEADAATYSIKYVVIDQKFDSLASDVFDELAVEGGACGAYFSVVPSQIAGRNPQIKIDRISWKNAVIDNYCIERDCNTGARFVGRMRWLDLDYAKEVYPDYADRLQAASSNLTLDNSQRQEDLVNVFYDVFRQRIAIYEIWERWKGKIYQGIFTEGVLIEYAESPYFDENGYQITPIELNSAYIDRNGNRYGEVRALVDPQDEVNHRHSKAIHFMSCRQFLINEPQAGVLAADVQDELAKPDGAIKLRDFGGFQLLETGDMVNGQLEMLANARDFILNNGARSQLASDVPSQSGRAALVEQSAGMAELGTIFDVHQEWKNRCYKKIWNLQKQFWSEEDWLTVLGSQKDVVYIGINQKITEGMKYIEQLEAQGTEITPEIQAQADAMTNVVEIRNNLPSIDVHFELDNSLDAPALESEQFQVLSQLIASAPNTPPARLELLIEASSFKNKKELLDLLKKETDQATQAANNLPPDVQQYIQQLEQQVAANASNMEVEKLKADTDLQVAQLNNETKKQIEAMNNQNRLQIEEIKHMLASFIKNQAAIPSDVAAENNSFGIQPNENLNGRVAV